MTNRIVYCLRCNRQVVLTDDATGECLHCGYPGPQRNGPQVALDAIRDSVADKTLVAKFEQLLHGQLSEPGDARPFWVARVKALLEAHGALQGCPAAQGKVGEAIDLIAIEVGRAEIAKWVDKRDISFFR